MRGDELVGLGVILGQLVDDALDRLLLRAGRRSPAGAALWATAARAASRDARRARARASRTRPRRAASTSRRRQLGLQRERELLAVERRAEAPVAVGVRQKLGLEELLIVARAPPTARARTPGSSPTNGFDLVVEELEVALVRLDAPARRRPWACGACRADARAPPLRRRETSAARRAARRTDFSALGLGREVAVDDVREPPADDLARVVVGERVVEARVPLPVADLAQVEELERDAVGEDLRVGAAVVAEIAGGDDGVELALLRGELGLALLRRAAGARSGSSPSKRWSPMKVARCGLARNSPSR